MDYNNQFHNGHTILINRKEHRMKKISTVFLLLMVVLVTVSFAKWEYAGVFPADTTAKTGVHKSNAIHGLTVTPDGNVWVQNYYGFTRDSLYIKADQNKYLAVRAIYVYKPDGTQASFSPIKFLTVNGVVDTVGGFTGLDNKWKAAAGAGLRVDPDGNVLATCGGSLYRINYKTGEAMNKAVPIPPTVAVPGHTVGLSVGVGKNGTIFTGTVLPGNPIKEWDKDFNALGTVKAASQGYARTMTAVDDNTVLWTSYTLGHVIVYSRPDEFSAFDSTDTILKGFAPESCGWNPKTGLLWISAGSYNDKPNQKYATSYTPATWYAYNYKTKAVVDSFAWKFYTDKNAAERPRAIAFSVGGDTAYVGCFSYGGIEVFVNKGGVSTNPVTFKVNMGIQEQLGKFNPTTDKVVVRGSFNGWAGNNDELKLGATAKVYEGTVNIPDTEIGKEHFYKFVIVKSTGDTWEADPNRTLVPKAGGQVVDVDYFDRKSTAAEVKTANVTFQADMAEMLQKGWFNPSTDQMRVTGGFNGWGYDAKYAMTQDLLDPALFLATVSITDEVNKSIGWKFRGYPEASFLDSGWEGGDNHTFTFTGNAMTLDKLKPNVKPAGKPLKQDVTVVFSVNIKGAKDFYNKKTFPTINGVYLNGDFAPLGSGGWAGWTVSDTLNALIRMYDDGTHSDKVAGDKIYTCEVPFKKDAAGARYFKFGIYAKAYTDTLNKGNIPMDNEAGFAANHLVIINDSQPVYIAPTEYFGSQWNPAVKVERLSSGEMPQEFALQQNYPNPFNPSTEISYTVAAKSKVMLAVYNMMGQKIATLYDGEQVAGTYRAIWNAQDEFGRIMPSGIYFCRMEADGMSKTIKMTLMK